MSRPDTIILGAGAAGLAAAAVLSEAGRSVVVLEARDRIGGRILTLRDARSPLPVELGAEFVHGRPESTWALIRRYSLPVIDLPFEHRQRRNGRLIQLRDFGDELQSVMSGLQRLGRRDISFGEYMRKHRGGSASARRLAIDFVQGFDAADPERISAKSLAQEMKGLGDVADDMQFRLVNGYGDLIGALRRSLDRRRVELRAGVVAREVKWRRGEVDVRCGAGGRGAVFSAPRAIVTLPLGVLQLPPESPGSVRFDPDIPGKRRAVNQLAFGPIVKAVLLFHEAFWENKDVARSARADGELADVVFMHNPDAAFPTCWTMRPMRAPILTAWAGGPKALAISGLGQDDLVRAAIASVAGLFNLRPARIRSLVRHAYVYDWPADPFSRGAYSYVAVGGGAARRALTRPEQGTLFFAGEAVDISGQASTVAGALASGQRAARAILDMG